MKGSAPTRGGLWLQRTNAPKATRRHFCLLTSQLYPQTKTRPQNARNSQKTCFVQDRAIPKDELKELEKAFEDSAAKNGICIKLPEEVIRERLRDQPRPDQHPRNYSTPSSARPYRNNGGAYDSRLPLAQGREKYRTFHANPQEIYKKAALKPQKNRFCAKNARLLRPPQKTSRPRQPGRKVPSVDCGRSPRRRKKGRADLRNPQRTPKRL